MRGGGEAGGAEEHEGEGAEEGGVEGGVQGLGRGRHLARPRQRATGGRKPGTGTETGRRGRSGWAGLGRLLVCPAHALGRAHKIDRYAQIQVGFGLIGP